MNKNKVKASILDRLFSIETVIVLAGIASLAYGFATSAAINIFWGVIILVGAVVLRFVKKKDWKAHWEEQERLRQAYMEREKREKERQDERKE